MSKAIQDLLALVKLLREEVAHQTNEISNLRRLIENCAGCRDTAPIQPKENCDNSNPCFEGVQCYDASNGVGCGSCPSGYSGDGRNCVLSNPCNSDPCPTGINIFAIK